MEDSPKVEPIQTPRPGLKGLVEAYERQLIEEALAVTAGNQRQAAAWLGVLPTTLHEKMKRLGISPAGARRADGILRG